MTKKVYTAIAAVMHEMAKTGIAKNRANSQQGYKFRGIDDIYNALSGMLAAAKLCIIPTVLNREVTERTNKNGTVLFYVNVDVSFDIVSAEDGSMHQARVCGEAMDSGDKATNKAMSAAYKYLAMQLFCIPTEGDNDADATTHQIAAQTNPNLVAAAKAAAAGTDALKAWFQSLPKAERETISKSKEWTALKAQAQQVAP